ncbi:transcriptional regulator PpsR [Aquisediminimonas profunda]|uniref:transcriptional regulator PpsR n=1 Tax=Aquisediminimonas profunda TaxID=1550733 RepID=UPI001C62CCA0|nr:transcriptional regulator PpsR [Aquisediminimonas profunda]
MKTAALAQNGTVPFRAPAQTLEGLDVDVTSRILAAVGDVTIVIDDRGIVRDVALGGIAVPQVLAQDWLDKPWVDTVTIESRSKIEEMLAAAASSSPVRWRQVNHVSEQGELPIRYLAISAGSRGSVIAIGRDMRAEAALQQRLLQAQQSIERDYVRLRQVEARYRMLFEQSSEVVFIVEVSSRQISDANPAACHLMGVDADALIGKPITSLFDESSRDAVIMTLGAVATAEHVEPAAVRMAHDGSDLLLSASLFRQERSSCFLVRLMTPEGGAAYFERENHRLVEVLDRMPDAFVITDDSLKIIAQNAAFLDMTQLSRGAQVLGQPLGRFVGRQGIDLNLLIAQLREHGSVRNFATIMRGVFDMQDEVEVSAVAVLEGDQPCFGFSIRNVGRRLSDLPVIGRELPRSVEQLTGLVGRVSLKEIVRESSDLIERLCIEAALKYTEDNRASAAEILGLSRQSLYSKLHRHKLGNLGEDEDGE